MRRFPKRIIKPVGSVLVLGVLYALAIQPALDFIPSLNITIINLGLIAAVVVLTISVSIAVITLVQKLGSCIDSKIIRNAYIVIFAVGGMSLILLFIFRFLPTSNYADMGILFQIAGFVMYLNPFKKHIVAFLVKDDPKSEKYDIATTATAIILVIMGLLMQLSYWNF